MRPLLVVLTILLIFSCKKDKLKGDKSVFIGKWKWVYTESVWSANCNNPPTTSILTPTTEQKNYSIEFLKKGCFILYENESMIDKYRIVFDDQFQTSTNPLFLNYFEFEIIPNNKSEITFGGYVNNDTLILKGFFPKESSNIGCLTNTNYFIRE